MHKLETVEATQLRRYVVELLEEEEARKLVNMDQDTDFQKLIGLVRTWECVLDEGGRFKNEPQSSANNIPEGYNNEGNPIGSDPL